MKVYKQTTSNNALKSSLLCEISAVLQQPQRNQRFSRFGLNRPGGNSVCKETLNRTTEMEVAVVFLLCAVAAVGGQMMGPMSGMGMGMGWGNPMWHGGMRYPGMMQTSQLNSMTYPTWRSHPIFRMVSGVSEKNVGSDVVNVAKVQPAHEVLTHMALASTNPKPYVDTIADFLYEPQKARAMMSPVGPMGTVSSVGPVAQMSPVYMQGMGMMRTMPNVGDDCGQQEGTRWERGLDWLY